MIIGIKSWNQLGDSIILTAAVRNIKLQYPEIKFAFAGKDYYKPLFENNPDFISNQKPDFILENEIKYGEGESECRRGTHTEAQTRTLCEMLCIPCVPFKNKTPLVHLTDEEKDWGIKHFQNKWLLNANCQTCSCSKFYPYWQDVVDGLFLRMEIVQVGGNELRDVSYDLHGVDDWRGKTTIRQYLSMVYGCKGIISPGSGIEHIGACFNKPMVILKGAREPVGVTNYPTAVYITSDCDSQFCFAQKPKDCRHFEKGFCRCMDINPAYIVDAVMKKAFPN